MNRKYVPKPISTKDVELSKDILELSEQIAKKFGHCLAWMKDGHTAKDVTIF